MDGRLKITKKRVVIGKRLNSIILMNLDSIKYGNSTKEQLQKIKNDKGGVLKAALKKGIVDDLIKNHPFPPNSSEETKRELEYLVKITKEADEDARLVQRQREAIFYLRKYPFRFLLINGQFGSCLP